MCYTEAKQYVWACLLESERTDGQAANEGRVRVHGSRRSTLAVIPPEEEAGIAWALSYLNRQSMSAILYGGSKPFVDESPQAPEVKKFLAIREQQQVRNLPQPHAREALASRAPEQASLFS